MIRRVLNHVESLWPGYTGLLLTLPFFGWFFWTVVISGERRAELFLIFFVVYDGMRFVKYVGITADRVHICDLRAIDMNVMSVDLGGGVRGSVHDFFLAHHTTVLDVICAIPYGTFIYVDVAFAIFLYTRDYTAMQRFGWTFLLLNLAGFFTYHLYPAAPPWYYHAHGCVADLTAHASEGPRLANVDALMGWKYFAGFYGRSNDVFGAVPSLHVAYPLLLILYGWRFFKLPLKVASGTFFGVMCFAAVYLDHHWIVDVILGIIYTLSVHNGVKWVWNRRADAAARPAAAPVQNGA